MRKLLVLLLLASPLYAQPKVGKCGVERQAVKTLADADGAKALAMSPLDAKISDLVKKASIDRATLQAARAKRFPDEMYRYRVPALVMGYKREGDMDFHIVLADPDNPSVTMIAEIPSPACVPPQYKTRFANLRIQFATDFSNPTPRYTKLAKPIRIMADGIFFFDFIHGQTGVAANGAELHPLLAWVKQ